MEVNKTIPRKPAKLSQASKSAGYLVEPYFLDRYAENSLKFARLTRFARVVGQPPHTLWRASSSGGSYSSFASRSSAEGSGSVIPLVSLYASPETSHTRTPGDLLLGHPDLLQQGCSGQIPYQTWSPTNSPIFCLGKEAKKTNFISAVASCWTRSTSVTPTVKGTSSMDSTRNSQGKHGWPGGQDRFWQTTLVDIILGSRYPP